MRLPILILVALLVSAVLVFAAPAQPDLANWKPHWPSNRPTNPHRPNNHASANITNAQALKEGLPLPRPRSIPLCVNGVCARAPPPKRPASAPSATTTILPPIPRDFLQTCDPTFLDTSAPRNPRLLGDCWDVRHQRKISASIQLSRCLSYDLVSQIRCVPNLRTNIFQRSCSRCTKSGATLTCQCISVRPGGPPVVTASIDLNECIGNSNGRLFC